MTLACHCLASCFEIVKACCLFCECTQTCSVVAVIKTALTLLGLLKPVLYWKISFLPCIMEIARHYMTLLTCGGPLTIQTWIRIWCAWNEFWRSALFNFVQVNSFADFYSWFRLGSPVWVDQWGAKSCELLVWPLQQSPWGCESLGMSWIFTVSDAQNMHAYSMVVGLKEQEWLLLLKRSASICKRGCFKLWECQS